MERKPFIQSIAAQAKEACKGTQLFTSLMIAQACLESNNGNSVLSSEHHNYFGMKPGKSWHGPIVEMNTKEYVKGQPVMLKQPFRCYDSFEDCMKDHVNMLHNVPCYAHAGVFSATTPEGQAKALLKAGYATDPAYASKLIAIINENGLKEYDS